VDPSVVQQQFPVVIALLFGLIAFKASITTFLGPRFGLTKAESFKTGFLLSGGGEFAFVVLTLADKLDVLPDELAKILVGVVVLSMALTPYLAKLGEVVADKFLEVENAELISQMRAENPNLSFAASKFNELDVDQNGFLENEELSTVVDWMLTMEPEKGDLTNSDQQYQLKSSMMKKIDENQDGKLSLSEFTILFEDVMANVAKVNNLNPSPDNDDINKEYDDNRKKDVIVICGFGAVGETVARCIERFNDSSSESLNYLAFDLGPEDVIAGYKNGFKVMYGDGTQQSVLNTAGIENVKAFVVTYGDPELSIKAVEKLHETFPTVPIYARAVDVSHFFEVMSTGALKAIQDDREASFSLSSSLLRDFGVKNEDIDQVNNELRLAMEVRDFEYLNRLKSSSYKDTSIELEETSDAARKEKTVFGMNTFDVGKKMLKFVNGSKRVVTDDTGNQIVTQDLSPLEIQEIIVESEKNVSIDENVAIEDLGSTVCLLPQRDKDTKGSDKRRRDPTNTSRKV